MPRQVYGVVPRQVLGVMSQQVLDISEDEDFTSYPRSMLQCSTKLMVKSFVFFNQNFLNFSLCQWPLVLSLGPTEKNLASCP